MKKYKFLPLLFIVPTLLTACQGQENAEGKKYTLTYGSMYDTDLQEISNFASLEKKIESDEETFLLAIHYGSNPSCGCWMTFKNQLKKLINKEHVRVYSFDTFKIDDANKFGFTPLTTDEPSLYLLSEGKIVKKYQYGNKKLESFFSDLEALKEELNSVINYPNFYYVNEEYLNENLFVNPVEKAAVFYMRNECGDCKYCLPHFMLPYGKENQLTTKVWLYDLQDLYTNSKDDQYPSIKAKYHLTEESDSNYGYVTGVVPTTQYWENGVLKDASVYFNDTVVKQENKYVIQDSFYSNERVNKLHYINDIETKVLEGLEIDKNNVEYYEEYGVCVWNQNEAAKYHDVFLKAFYDYYLK